MPSRTNLKLSEMIRHRASHVILFELKDPRMGIVTITRVKLARDLTTVTIFWSVLGDSAQRSKTMHALDHARLFVQRRVAEGLRLRNAPQISFEYDESVEGALRMGGLLKQLREERGEPAPDEPAPDEPKPDEPKEPPAQ
jgi:ribosome-binding factor A